MCQRALSRENQLALLTWAFLEVTTHIFATPNRFFLQLPIRLRVFRVGRLCPSCDDVITRVRGETATPNTDDWVVCTTRPIARLGRADYIICVPSAFLPAVLEVNITVGESHSYSTVLRVNIAVERVLQLVYFAYC